MTTVGPVTVPNQRFGYPDRMEQPVGGTEEREERFIPASPESLRRIEGLVGEVWGMRPAQADAQPAGADRYVSFGLAGLGQWGLAFARREGDQEGVAVPAVTSQGAYSIVPELYAMAGGTVWRQEGEGVTPVDAGAHGADEMISILETIRAGMLSDPRDCLIDGQPLDRYLSSAAR